MARKVIWSFEATDDLDTLSEYIAKDSLFYAAAFTREVLDASSSLHKLSERGRLVPELGNSEIRELLIRDYRLIYTIEESRIVILALVHGARDLMTLWEKENRG
jgi:plasmid stabilization system protein ParE